jgi:hypothetical protein
MMLSREQGECCAQPGNSNSYRDADRVRGGHSTVIGLASLPLSSDDSCCTTGFGGSQVSWANSAREIGGLGQVLTEVTASGECCVSSGCGCGPDGNSASGDPQREAPFGVDQVNGTPVDGVCCENVGYNNTLIADVKSWSPEGGIDGDRQKAKNRDAANEAVCCEGEQCCSNSQTENSNGDHAENSAGAGHERRHVNNAGTKVER